MIPWRSTQVIGAFVAGLVAIRVTSEVCLRAQVPLWAAVPALVLAGAVGFTGALLVLLRASFRRNRVRRAVRQGWPGVRDLCAAVLRQGWAETGRDEGPLFLDDRATVEVQRLRRALAQAGVLASSAEVKEYLLLCRWARRSGAGVRPGDEVTWLPASGRPAGRLWAQRAG